MICKTLLILLCFMFIERTFANPMCGKEGQPECKYVPALPGNTPKCASPGSTYCENIDSYPTDLVKKLLQNYKLEVVLASEKKSDYDELSSHPNYGVINNETQLEGRAKRETLDDVQSKTMHNNPLREQLCRTISKYTAPKAAKNSLGNWLYLVGNSDELNVTQNVRIDICASTTCASDLCQLPNNYNSRCEQRFTQKRLLAVYPDGSKLFTDFFWFPFCCVCTFSNM